MHTRLSTFAKRSSRFPSCTAACIDASSGNEDILEDLGHANGDTLRLVFSAYPAIDELYTEHELGMFSDLQALQYTQDGYGNS
jgi:hypothetical protein